MTRALTMLQAVFRAHDLPHVVHVGAAQALLDLTRPDTYFSEDEVGVHPDPRRPLTPHLHVVARMSRCRAVLPFVPCHFTPCLHAGSTPCC